MLGGEGPATIKWMTKGAWVEMYAPAMNALAYQLEHRYYGDSHPTEDLSTQNLQWLTSEQALFDAANFITNQTAQLGLQPWQAKWIVFGGSYSGALAAWMRLKFPNIVFASVGSSAPVDAQLNFATYQDNVVYAMNWADPSGECVLNVRHAVRSIEGLLKDPNNGPQKLQQKFKVCSTLNPANTNDVDNLFEALAGNFQGVVQYNRDNRDGPLHTLNVTYLCDIMKNKSNDNLPLDNYARVNDVFLETFGQKCLDIDYNKMIADMKNTSWDGTDAEGGRQWFYQTCNEFGYY